MNKEIERLIQINVLRDIEIKFREAKLDGQIIPEIVFELMKTLEDEYNKK